MRHIVRSSLVFSLGLGAVGCAPRVPGLEPAGAAALDAGPGSDPRATGDPSTAGGPASPPPSRPGAVRGDGGGPARGDARGDLAEDRPASVDASAERAASDTTSEAPAAREPRAGEIVIDELLVDPAGADLGHEWIEIANVTREALDLGALRVSDGTSEAAVDGGILSAGGLLVLGQSIDRAHNGDAPVDLAYGTKLSLNNDADRVALCLGPCASGVALDAVAWSAPWGAAYVGHAVVVEPGGRTCPAAEPYGAGGNFGSPGGPNPPCPALIAEPARDAATESERPADAAAEY
jgi:hypothetical protein